jgi:predicted esterase
MPVGASRLAPRSAQRSDAAMHASASAPWIVSCLLAAASPALAHATAAPSPARAATATDDALTAACAWLQQPEATRGAAPGADAMLAPADVGMALDRLAAAWRAGVAAHPWDDLRLCTADQPGALRLGEFSMPYVLWSKGERPANGWPLFLCLHGGGGNDKADGPHGWRVNTREWQAQQQLAERLYPSPGLYFVPRMADDRRGRWWFDHNQIAFERVVREAIARFQVDPDRVYLLGISEGGYGAIRFAGNRPDRFAACGGMAAAEPLGTSPPENMRNVALRIDIGEKDTMFDRVGLARTMGARLAELQAQDAGGFDHLLNVQPGRGHGIDYKPCPEWLATKVRNPRPDRVTWVVTKFDSRLALHHHWLGLAEEPATLPMAVDATLRDQKLVVTTQRTDDHGRTAPAFAGTLRVFVDGALADLGKPLAVTVDGVERPAVALQPTIGALATTLAERGDPRLAFPCVVDVPFGRR